MSQPEVYQIVWKPDQRASVEAGYRILDNTTNERPDWYEYWPIRQFWQQPERSAQLLQGTLDDRYFGFFSPKFASKTLLVHAQMTQVLEQGIRSGADVVTFSPQPDMSAFYLNVFEQQDAFDAGFMALSESFFRAAGYAVVLRDLVMDSSTTVFSNYFVAKGRFWREWLALNEQLFAWAEQPQNDDWLHQLSAPTRYPGGAQAKVFLMERTASFLLAASPQRWRVYAANPWTMAWSMSRLREFPHEAVVSDALKSALRTHGWPVYRQAFGTVRQKVLQGLASGPYAPPDI